MEAQRKWPQGYNISQRSLVNEERKIQFKQWSETIYVHVEKKRYTMEKVHLLFRLAISKDFLSPEDGSQSWLFFIIIIIFYHATFQA